MILSQSEHGYVQGLKDLQAWVEEQDFDTKAEAEAAFMVYKRAAEMVSSLEDRAAMISALSVLPAEAEQ